MRASCGGEGRVGLKTLDGRQGLWKVVGKRGSCGGESSEGLVWAMKVRINRPSETWSRSFTQGIVDSYSLVRRQREMDE